MWKTSAALVAGGEQAARGLPDFGRIVVPELVGDQLVHCDVEARIHSLAVDQDLLFAALDRPRELRVLGKDQEVAVVGIGRVEERQVEITETTVLRRAGEAVTLSVVGRLELIHAGIFASEIAAG
jgi:hypothetical protein